MTKLPWAKYYADKYLSDSAVGKCSLSARGLWWELLSIMMLEGTCSVTGTPEQIARMARCLVSEVGPALAELENTNCATVTHSNNIVTLVCRRLQREQKDRKNTAERVRRYRTKNECNAESNGIEYRRQKTEDRSNKDFVVLDDDWELPDGWDCPELRKALDGWSKMRSRIRKPVRSKPSTSKIFKQFESVKHLITVLEICESNEWQGLKPEYAKPTSGNGMAKRLTPRSNNSELDRNLEISRAVKKARSEGKSQQEVDEIIEKMSKVG